MMRLGILTLTILSLVTFGPRDCVAPNTDLQIVPVSGTGPTAFCCEGNSSVCFMVRNVGSGPAAATTARVTFLFTGSPLPANIAVAPLDPGATSPVISVPIPTGCFDADCDYQIQIDVGGTANESNETNNSVTAHCVG